jgi:hypothetical protein
MAAPSAVQGVSGMSCVRCVKAFVVPVSIGVSACAGEPRTLEPRSPPPRQMPAVALPPTPLAPGQARVVFEGIDGPMRLSVQSDPTFVPPGADRAPSRVGELCVTPCVADLPAGRYRLFLAPTGSVSSGDTDDITVSPGLTVYRRAPGKYETPSFANAIPPALLLTVSLVLTVWAPLIAAASNDSGTRTGWLAVAGLAVAGDIGGGFWLYDSRRAIQQQGATTLWQESTR